MTQEMSDISLLCTVIEKELTLLGQLSDLLEQEKNQLELSDVAAVNAIVAEKAPVIGQLDSNHKTKCLILNRLGVATSREAIANVLMPHTTPTWQEKLEQLYELAKDCQDKNMVNGCIITATVQQSRRLLQALTGSGMATYSKDGNHLTASSGQSIAKA